MKVKTISYAKVFPIAPYENQKIGVEMELDETDDWQEVFDLAKKMVHKWANPQPTFTNETLTPIGQPLPSIDYRAKEKLEIDIDNATTKADLEFYVEAAEKYGLMELWNEKNKSLNS